MEDKYMIPELNRAISQNLTTFEPSQSGSLSSLQNYLRREGKKETVIELNYE
jgi:hypothetical protein